MTSPGNWTGGRLLKRGGANNRADRTSFQLTKRQCEDVLDASMAAAKAGMPFNRYITNAWGKGGIEAKDSVKATGEFVRLAREWHRERGHAMPWVWVQENGRVYGGHCHLLLHVPEELDPLFRPMPLRWTKKVLAGPYVKGTVQSQRIASKQATRAQTGHYMANLHCKLHYMLKCAPAALERELDMEGLGHKEWGQSCKVYGKRIGVWQGWEKA